MTTEVRFRWVLDDDYETRGSYGYDTPEETKAAEDEELAKLDSGEYVAEGCIAELISTCAECGEEKVIGEASLWGIVHGFTPDDDAYRQTVEADLKSEVEFEAAKA